MKAVPTCPAWLARAGSLMIVTAGGFGDSAKPLYIGGMEFKS
ncbi:hypothetical protein [Microvirga rosea]|nr:hypothetical protein [Microvirga rosea]